MAFKHLSTRLLKQSGLKLLVIATLLAIAGTMVIVIAMGLLLKGYVPLDYLLTGLVASLCVGAIVSRMLIDIAHEQNLLNARIARSEKDQKMLDALSNERGAFYSIIEDSVVPYALNDSMGNIVHVNQAFVRTFGYTLKEIPTLEAWWPQAYPDPEYRDWVRTTWFARLEDQKQTGEPFDPLEIDIRCKDGTVRTTMASTAHTKGLFEELDLIVLYDISAQKLAANLASKNAAHYRHILDLAPFPIVIINAQSSTLVYGNNRAQILFGVSQQQGMGFPSTQFYASADDRQRMVDIVHATGHIYDFETRLRTMEGRIFWATISSELIEFEGQPSVLSCINDIDARKQAEENQKHIAEQYRLLIDTIGIPIAISSITTGKTLYANERARNLFKVDEAMSIGVTVTDFYARPEQRQEILDKVTRGESVHDFEIQMRRADGEIFWALLSAVLVHIGGESALLSSINDIQERKNTDELMRNNAQRYRNLIDTAPFPVVVTDVAASNLLYANPRAATMFVGASLESFSGDRNQILGQPTSQFFVDPELHKKLRTFGMENLHAGQSSFEYEAEMRTWDGREIWALLSIAFIEFDGNPALITCITDITTHKLAAQIMQQSALRYRNLIETAPFPMIVAEIESGAVLFANQRAVSLFKVPDDTTPLAVSTKGSYVDPDKRAEVLELLNQGKPVIDYEIELRKFDGATFWALLSVVKFEFDGKPALLTSVNDISERRSLQTATEEARKLLHTVLQTMPQRVFWKDLDSRYLGCNPAFARDAGLNQPSELIGKTDYDMGWKDQAALYRADDQAVMQGRQPKLNFIEPQTAPDGSTIWLETSKVPIYDTENKVMGVLGVYADITERKLADEKLALSARVFSEAHEGILISDARGLIIDVNPTFTQITGYSREEVLGRNPSMLKSGRQPPEFYEAMWRDLGTQGYWQGEVWNRKKDGTLYAELLSISALRDEAGKVHHYIALFSDITHSKNQQQKLEMLAHYDVLTRLPNRVLFADRFNQAIARCKRDTHSMLAVCYLDLDGFKQVNDTLGHEAGDQLLVQVSERIKTMLREEDTVSRLGGDEFAMLLGDLKSLDQCKQALDRIHRTIAQPYLLGNESVTIGASSGVAIYPLDEADPDTLLRHADQAMYEAKMAGRNRYQLFDAEHDLMRQKHRVKLDSLELAMERGELRLYYQPKVNMKTGEVFGVEALIRWIHPERGLVPPIEFLPMLESTPMEITLGNWVISEAMKQLDLWRKSGIDLQVSVNISPLHLQEKSFFANLDAALAKYPEIPSNKFEIEVLESSVVEDLTIVSDVLAACRDALGVNIALDDFGTGYSSLTHLRHLPANMVKIDQSFVRDMLDDPDDFAIIEGVVGLTNAFRRKVIAEGVETPEHGLMLLAIGCPLAQGYAIARPMPAENIQAWIQGYQPHPSWLSFTQAPQSPACAAIILLNLTLHQWLSRINECLDTPSGGAPHWPIMRWETSHCGRLVIRAERENLFESEKLQTLKHAHQQLHALGGSLMRQYIDGNSESLAKDRSGLNEACKHVESLLQAITKSLEH